MSLNHRYALWSLCAIYCFVAPIAHATQEGMEVERMQESATDIVTGVVESIATTKEGRDHVRYYHVAKIRVLKVDKGENIAAGEHVDVRYSTESWEGDDDADIGCLSGHYPTPNPEAKVRVYLYDGRVGFTVLDPNGFTILTPGTPQPISEGRRETWSRPAMIGALLSLCAALLYSQVWRSRKK